MTSRQSVEQRLEGALVVEDQSRRETREDFWGLRPRFRKIFQKIPSFFSYTQLREVGMHSDPVSVGVLTIVVV